MKIRVNVKHMYEACPFLSLVYEETSNELLTVNSSSIGTPNKATHCVLNALQWKKIPITFYYTGDA